MHDSFLDLAKEVFCLHARKHEKIEYIKVVKEGVEAKIILQACLPFGYWVMLEKMTGIDQ